MLQIVLAAVVDLTLAMQGCVYSACYIDDTQAFSAMCHS